MSYWNDDFFFWRRRKPSIPREAKGALKRSLNGVPSERVGGQGDGSLYLKASILERDWAEADPMQEEARFSLSK